MNAWQGTSTYSSCGHGDLGQVDLIETLLVAQAILAAVCYSLCRCRAELLQLLDGAVPVHLEVDADAAVHGASGHVQVNIGHAGLDNLVEDLPSFLVIRDSGLYILSRQSRAHAARNTSLHVLRQLKVLVHLAAVFVLQLHAVFAVWRAWVRLDDHVVEKFIVCLVLCLRVWNFLLVCAPRSR